MDKWIPGLLPAIGFVVWIGFSVVIIIVQMYYDITGKD